MIHFSTLKMEAVFSSEQLVSSYQTIQCYISEDSILNITFIEIPNRNFAIIKMTTEFGVSNLLIKTISASSTPRGALRNHDITEYFIYTINTIHLDPSAISRV